MANSYNGWQASPSAAAIGINTNFRVLGAAFPSGVKAGDVEKIFTYLITRLHNEVEPMMVDPGTGKLGYGCWGYAYRANVNNPSTLSCHASGTAIDYNATKHANGTSTGPNGGGGWSGSQYQKIQSILGTLQGTVRWLTGNDPMHFEINGSAAKVSAVAATLPGGNIPVPGTPNIPEPEKDWWDTVDEARAKQVMKEALEETLGRSGKVDGLFLTDVIADIWNRGKGQQALLERILTEVSEYDVVLYQDGTGLWWSEAGVSRPIPDVETLEGLKMVAEASGKKVLTWPGGDVNLPGAFGGRGESGSLPGPDAVTTPTPVETYTVVAGDTFSGIAKKLGVSVDALKAANPQVTNVDQIEVGQVLNAPKS